MFSSGHLSSVGTGGIVGIPIIPGEGIVAGIITTDGIHGITGLITTHGAGTPGVGIPMLTVRLPMDIGEITCIIPMYITTIIAITTTPMVGMGAIITGVGPITVSPPK